VERLGSLTPREQEALKDLPNGKPNKVIAYDLVISVRTVEVHLSKSFPPSSQKSNSSQDRESLPQRSGTPRSRARTAELRR
jgi:FixJ family two-component response regulator